MMANLETPPQLCPSIPIVILLPHTYSTMLIIGRQFCFNKLLLPHTQFTMFIITRELRNPFPAYLAASCLLAYAIYPFFPRSFPSFGDFRSFS
jgi:hypothetical protein